MARRPPRLPPPLPPPAADAWLAHALARPLLLLPQYDTDVTTWSPQGRIFQIEYAMEAVKQGSAAVGLKVRCRSFAALLPTCLGRGRFLCCCRSAAYLALHQSAGAAEVCCCGRPTAQQTTLGGGLPSAAAAAPCETTSLPARELCYASCPKHAHVHPLVPCATAEQGVCGACHAEARPQRAVVLPAQGESALLALFVGPEMVVCLGCCFGAEARPQRAVLLPAQGEWRFLDYVQPGFGEWLLVADCSSTSPRGLSFH